MSTEQQLSLRHLIREVLAESDTADPVVIAERVMARIPAGSEREILEQTIRPFIRTLISHIRTRQDEHTTVSPSWKVAGVREAWRDRLHVPLHVGDGKWKFLSECSADDLRAAAEERRVHAAQVVNWAETYEKWANLMRRHQAVTFGDLPPEVLVKALES